jgi:hypothetical protein
LDLISLYIDVYGSLTEDITLGDEEGTWVVAWCLSDNSRSKRNSKDGDSDALP